MSGLWIVGSRSDVQGIALAPPGGRVASRIARVPDGAIIALLIAAGALFYLAPLPLALAGLLVVAVLTWGRLDLGLLLVPLFLPFWPDPRRIGHEHISAAEAFLLIDVALAIGLMVTGRISADWQSLRRNPFVMPAALLLAAASISAAVSVERHLAFEWYRWVIIEPLLYFMLLLLFVRTRRGWLLVASALAVAGVTVCLLALGQYVTHRDLSVVPSTGLKRVQGPYGSPDNLGLLLDRVIPIWLAVLLLSRMSVRKRLVWALAAPFFGVVLYLTYSRGAWLAVSVGVLFTLALAYRWGRWVVVAALALSLVAVGVEGHRIQGALTSGHSGTVSTRLDIWRSGVRMVRDHPIIGVGIDNFQHYYAPTRKENRWQKECAPGLGYIQPGAGAEPCFSHPHNELLDFWLSTGIFGLLAFVWLQVVFWRQAISGWFRHHSALVLGSMAAMVAALVHGFVDNSYFLPDLALIFWMLCGLVSAVPAAGPPEDAS